ncbi:LOW QUALITY PROTEIN: solute carrier family 2, facilitated glucose transporter member 1-like [Paramacrobiotus metropolitanus]|uniref:LOW QUALITY PROTEIN: solute carrier family 2, facilitated glucose transporter member 1-like n=1 Tax=Paramacrobiotus metropolitanus TaxID=2943436 RepID=UPI002445D4DE|nr:LOW QUALITY PROTEIN: solute carrier family 2, facilitated glucose transporter member 1-like [Paramacrobiotus metropolitanus]
MEPLKGQQPSGITGKLIITLVAATLGTYFTIGFGVSSLNGPQNIVLQWIRDVKCRSFGGEFGMTYNSINDTEHDPNVTKNLWCRPFPATEEKEMLAENTELNTLWALIASGICTGAVLTVLTCSSLIQWFGVRNTLIISASIFAVGCILCGFCKVADSWPMLMAGRMILGMACGLETTVVAMYMSEVTPIRLRGAAGTLPIVMYVIGLMLATGFGFPEVLGTERLAGLAGAAALPCIVSCIVLLKCPESPRFLFISRGKKIDAQQALVWLRGTTLVTEELDEMAAEAASLRNSRKVTFIGLFTDPFLRRIALLAAVPMLAQQLSGYNCVGFYSTSIFAGIGLDRRTALFATLGLWSCFALASGISMVLVDRLGRRILLAISGFGVILALVMYTIFATMGDNGVGEGTKLATALCLPGYVLFYGIGVASVPWILAGELFTQEARSAATTLVSVVCWLVGAVVSNLFPLMVVAMSHYTFLIFAVLVLVCAVYLLLKLPETKGLTVENIQKKLHSGGL